jgi:hypothetical protein
MTIKELPQMRAAKFTIDTFDGEVFDGFTIGETWNGWARPYFTFEQAQRVVEAHQAHVGTASYEEGEDAFSFEMSEDEVDTFPAETVEGQKLYPIGAGCWIWEEAIEEVAQWQASAKSG